MKNQLTSRGLVHRRCLLVAMLIVFGMSSQCRAAEVTHKVRMYWSFGQIEIDLFGDDSPRHVANFLRYADAGLYDDTYSHRSNSGSSLFIQGGSFYLPNPPSLATLALNSIPTFSPVDNEFDASNGLSNTPTSLAAARTSDPDSATSGWFFNVTDNSAGFDSGPYTVFGEVSEGWSNFGALPYQPLISDVYTGGYSSAVASTPLVNTAGEGEPANWLIPRFDKWIRIPTTPGDFNLDGLVNAADQAVWQAGQGDYSTANLTADADGDGDVDNDDLTVWQNNQGSGVLKNVAGDYNGNGSVDDADYLWWTTLYGTQTTLDADGNGNGIVDAADYTVWRDNLPSASSATGVPEPSSAILCLIGCALAGCRRTRQG